MEREKLPVKLLKSKKVKDGKTYNNLYLQFGDGNPIAIELVHWNFKVRNLLLAQATDFEVSRVVKVSTEEQAGKSEKGGK